MSNVSKGNANIEINEKIFCHFQRPKFTSDFFLNALALKSVNSILSQDS